MQDVDWKGCWVGTLKNVTLIDKNPLGKFPNLYGGNWTKMSWGMTWF